MKPTVLAFALLAALIPPQTPTADSPVELDHVFLWVTPGAPERAALERLGFRISPVINRHDGQGTASCTVEFVNGFLELIWPDSSVAAANPAVTARFVKRMEWGATGFSPVGVGLRPTAIGRDSLPFPTWPLVSDWLPKGSAILRMTPLTDSLGAMLFLSPAALVTPPDSNLAWLIRRDARGEALRHPNGCRTITGLRVIAPERGLNDATTRLDRWNVAKFARGEAWCVELTLDRARLGKVADLRPTLPLVLKY